MIELKGEFYIKSKDKWKNGDIIFIKLCNTKVMQWPPGSVVEYKWLGDVMISRYVSTTSQPRYTGPEHERKEEFGNIVFVSLDIKD